jgi:hypothetical protein
MFRKTTLPGGGTGARGGVGLSTLVKLPAEGEGPWPAILQRRPYAKSRGANAGDNFTRRGYAYVIQRRDQAPLTTAAREPLSKLADGGAGIH